LKTWTIWWWDERDPIPAPYSARRDKKREALEFAVELTTDPPDWLTWVKVFRTDNEGYVVFRWARESLPPPPLHRSREKARHDASRIIIGVLVLTVLLLVIVNVLIYAK